MDLENKVIELAAMSFRKDASEISAATNIREELSEKSIMMLGFISAIENDLEVSIPLSKANHLDTIQDFIDEIKSLQG